MKSLQQILDQIDAKYADLTAEALLADMERFANSRGFSLYDELEEDADEAAPVTSFSRNDNEPWIETPWEMDCNSPPAWLSPSSPVFLDSVADLSSNELALAA